MLCSTPPANANHCWCYFFVRSSTQTVVLLTPYKILKDCTSSVNMLFFPLISKVVHPFFGNKCSVLCAVGSCSTLRKIEKRSICLCFSCVKNNTITELSLLFVLFARFLLAVLGWFYCLLLLLTLLGFYDLPVMCVFNMGLIKKEIQRSS